MSAELAPPAGRARAGAAREWRFAHFFAQVPKSARILEIGCGDGWLGRRLRRDGYTRYTGLDLLPPADVVGDVRAWRALGLAPRSYDVIAAFEVVEHVACFDAIHELLADDGEGFVTTPIPHMDWACRALEALGVNQPRTSPHSHLVYLTAVRPLRVVRIRYPALVGQWAVMRKRRATGAAAP